LYTKDNHIAAKKMKIIFTVSKWRPKHLILQWISVLQPNEQYIVSIEWSDGLAQ
jgi:hypothetical protein